LKDARLEHPHDKSKADVLVPSFLM
jgi:hypothetical protein